MRSGSPRSRERIESPAPSAAMMAAGGENTKCPVVWSGCGSVSMRKRTGRGVSFLTAARTARESVGLCPLSMSTTPSWEDDAAVGIEVLADVDVDPVLELPDLRPQVLGGREADGEEPSEDRECVFEFHGAPS